MGRVVTRREDFDGAVLRGLAKASKDAGQSRRLLALAEIYDGGKRRDAARIGDVERRRCDFLAVHRDPPVGDPALRLAARTQPGAGHDLGDPLTLGRAIGFRGVHPRSTTRNRGAGQWRASIPLADPCRNQ